MRRGIRLVLIGLLLGLLSFVIVAPLVIRNPKYDSHPITTAACAICGILWMIGTWLLTQPDPTGAGETRYGRPRRVVRASLIAWLCGFVLLLAVIALNWPKNVAFAILSALMLIMVVGWIAQIDYLRKLARRMGDSRLAGRAQFLMYAMGSSYVCMTALEVLIGWLGNRIRPAAVDPLRLLIGIIGIAGLVFFVMYVFMVDRFGRRFAVEAKVAAETWAGTPSA